MVPYINDPNQTPIRNNLYGLPFTSVALPPLPRHAPDAPSVQPLAIPSSSRALPPLRDNFYPASSLPSFDEEFGNTPDSKSQTQRVVPYEPYKGGRQGRAPSPETPVAGRSSRDAAVARVSSRAMSAQRSSGGRCDAAPFHSETWNEEGHGPHFREETPALMPDEGDESDCSDHFDDPPRSKRSNGSLRSSTYRHDRRRRAPYEARRPSRYAISPAMSSAYGYSPAIGGQSPWNPFVPAFQQMSLSPASPAMPFMYGPVAHPDPNLSGDVAYVAYFTAPRMGSYPGMPVPRPIRTRSFGNGSERSVSTRESRPHSRHPETSRIKAEREHRSRRPRANTLLHERSSTELRDEDDVHGSRAAQSLPDNMFWDQPSGNEANFAETTELPTPADNQREIFNHVDNSQPAAIKRESSAAHYCPGYVWDVLAPADIVAKYKNNKEVQKGTKHQRPAGNYADLIGRALLESAPPHQLDVARVFKAIAAKHAHFTLDPRLLYNGIRHSINNNVAFTRVQRPHGEPHAQANHWRVTPGYEYWFEEGAQRPRAEPQPRRTASESSSIGPFHIEMDDSPEIPLRSLFEVNRRERARTPEASNVNMDVDRTPVGPTINRTPLARSAERPPRLDMQAIRSHSIMSGFSASAVTQGDNTPALSFDDGSSARPSPFSFMDLSAFSIPHEATRNGGQGMASPNTSLGFPSSSFNVSSAFLSQQNSRKPLANKTNQQDPAGPSALGFSPFAKFSSHGGGFNLGYDQSPDIVSPLPQALAGPGLHKPVSVRSLSALSTTRPGSATTSVSSNSVSSLASAMDFSLVRSRHA